MASGFEPDEIYVRILAPSLHAIGASWRSGRVSIDQEHLASSVATKLIGRLGPRFVHPGRKKGVVILAMPPGERHGLGVAMIADILADAGYEVLNLGPDTPTASLVAAMRDAGSLAAVVVSVVDIERRAAAGRLLAAARRERPSVPRLVGGNAVPDERAALDLGADGWVADPRGARRPDRSAQGTGMTQPGRAASSPVMRILVVGASGYIGGRLVPLLAARGHRARPDEPRCAAPRRPVPAGDGRGRRPPRPIDAASSAGGGRRRLLPGPLDGVGRARIRRAGSAGSARTSPRRRGVPACRGSSTSGAWATIPPTSPTTWPAATRPARSSPRTACRSPSSARRWSSDRAARPSRSCVT